MLGKPILVKQKPRGRFAIHHGPLAYLLAAVLVAAAFFLRLALNPLWENRFPFVLFFVAVFVVAQFAGAGPSAFATVAGFFLGVWFFMAPRHTLLVHDRVNQLNGVFYFGLCFVFSWFSLQTRRALRQERAARATLGELAAIIESSDDAIVGKSLDGRILSWNAAAQKLYGYTAAEAIGQTTELVFPPGGGENHQLLLERVRRGENISHFETRRRRKSGELLEVSLTMSPVRNESGEIIGASTIARDISARKKAEREREQLVAELQAALGQVKTLSGLLPLCSHCKKIRDDKGYWSQIELYVREHSNASFTHGICPECAERVYRDLTAGDSTPQ